MKPIRVFFVLPVMKGGGAEKVASVLLNHIDRDRFVLTLVLFNKTGEYLRNVPADVEIVDLEKRNKFGFFALILRLRRLIRKRRPDIVMSSLYYPNIITVLARLGLDCRTRVIVTEHSNHRKLLPFKRFRKVVRRLMSFTYRRADRIVTVSQTLMDDLVSDFGIDAGRFRVIHNPNETEKVLGESREDVAHPFFDSGEDGFVVIGVGRLSRAKNFDLLIRAAAGARRKLPLRLIIVGEGEDRAFLEDVVRQENLEEHVAFVGFQNNPYNWIARSDLFVLSSAWEGFGIVLAEAQICGTAVVATNCHGGTNEIVTDGVDGRVVPVGDLKALTGAIEEIAGDRILRESFVAKGLENARRFDCATIVPRYEQVFEESLSL
jgi:glycosyltransferase involved in cell wall biosynthesis